jgi:adenine phosphoribosyltransferase
MTETDPRGGPVTITPDFTAGSPAVDVLRAHVRDVLDFPKPGVVFKDITPLLSTPEAFAVVIDHLSAQARAHEVSAVVGIEARGFLLAAPVAYQIGASLVPMRKPGKLPGATIAESYELEYGAATLEVHEDAFPAGARVLLIDDVLATGGTAAAAANLVRRAGAVATGLSVLMELTFLSGRETVGDLPVSAMMAI